MCHVVINLSKQADIEQHHKTMLCFGPVLIAVNLFRILNLDDYYVFLKETCLNTCLIL